MLSVSVAVNGFSLSDVLEGQTLFFTVRKIGTLNIPSPLGRGIDQSPTLKKTSSFKFTIELTNYKRCNLTGSEVND